MSKKILVVDDDFEQRDLYASLFRENGFDVKEAPDGLAGLELALKEHPDMVFTGIIMPRMDGFELIKNLRNNTVTALTPVVMFSHLGREEDRVKALALSYTEFVIKGYDTPRQILEKVSKILSQEPKGHPVAKPHVEDDREGTGLL